MNKKEYQKEYQLRRYHKRRNQAVTQLGKICSRCGSEKDLQIDHIDPSKKSIDVARLWGVAEKRYQEEIKKCQLLCWPCHILKTIKDKGETPTKGFNVHGTLTSYKYCKCSICKDAWNKHHQEWKASKKGV